MTHVASCKCDVITHTIFTRPGTSVTTSSFIGKKISRFPSQVRRSTCLTSNYQKCHRLVKLSCRADINSNVSRDAMTYQIDIGIIYRFRGIVETGYGRGGKKLEFPTANLGPSTFYVF